MRRNFPMLRKFILLAGDFVLLAGAAYLAFQAVFSRGAPPGMADSWRNMVAVMLCVAVILFNVHGLFSLARKKFSELAISLAVALANIFIIIMAVSFFLRDFTYSRTLLVLTFAIQLVLLLLWKYLFWRIEHALISPKDVLIVGTQQECARLVAKLQAQLHLNYNVRYVCTDCEGNSWQKAVDDIDLVIICPGTDVRNKAGIVHFCHNRGKRVFLVPDFYTLFASAAEMDKIDDIPVFRARYLEPTLEQRILKRMLDLTVAGSALFALWPLFIVIATMIRLDSPGPVIYSQVRVGRNEKEFKVFKFRTMRQDAEKYTGPVLAAENDPRITRVGRLLRATRLDELPQLFNVLKGDMSIVGPRPERPVFVRQFKEEIPEYVYRHNVKPGITGLAQVYGKYNTTPYDKLIYDLSISRNLA
ncbi:sugar transferase [Sporolituus thermophilus]|uniref:Exopolysaccharide biosynthesis polyprenyl glycosylphosphotransferase n=1 Tax=Sporolituus thermophilus DSM 23256 TaxID=1123285 RepID=A0A1G7NCH6_9FIRM|nr:sugar transferase [Sporolituus thermophilus]SDF71607.1 exopolysaccharide biosynthesis polyprenyl glycosylphosphotransferase [Sporolituus thermophilus DSM 23256]